MLRALVATLFVVAAAGPARAEDPITVVLGVGPTVTRRALDDETSRLSLALHVDVGARVHHNVSLGLHGGTSVPTSAAEFVFDGPSEGDAYNGISYAPLEMGVGGTVTVVDRAWIAPWLGTIAVHATDSVYAANPRMIGFGADLGFDLYVNGGDRIGVFGSFTRTVGDNDFRGFSAMTFGATYRRR